MRTVLDDLVSLLQLDRIEENIFRGDSRDIGSAQVFGGQVVAQALSAAHHTVEDRVAHSLHAYFLRRGDMKSPIIYEVDRSRDGGSFSVRRVVAIQHGRPIFNLAASFQKSEEGLDHQITMPEVEGPENLKNISQLLTKEITVKIPEKLKKFLTSERPFEFRPVQPINILKPGKLPPIRHVWIRALNSVPDDPHLHQCLLAYVSDFELLGTSLRPHGYGLPFGSGILQVASLDHAIWFHRECRVDEWLLYSSDSPNAYGARGYARGQIFKQDGKLLASVTQEGLIRTPNKDQKSSRPSDPRLQI
ncbi:MAG TPA: acyl-CoA thioesterase II [Woeseiaceae bacterium]|nr:acyl-CoA thioesterase II [Woeseiaceae bacterium]